MLVVVEMVVEMVYVLVFPFDLPSGDVKWKETDGWLFVSWHCGLKLLLTAVFAYVHTL